MIKFLKFSFFATIAIAVILQIFSNLRVESRPSHVDLKSINGCEGEMCPIDTEIFEPGRDQLPFRFEEKYGSRFKREIENISEDGSFLNMIARFYNFLRAIRSLLFLVYTSKTIPLDVVSTVEPSTTTLKQEINQNEKIDEISTTTYGSSNHDDVDNNGNYGTTTTTTTTITSTTEKLALGGGIFGSHFFKDTPSSRTPKTEEDNMHW